MSHHRNMKDLLNQVLGESSFLERDAFASATDPDAIQMVAFANRAAIEYAEFHPWNRLRKSASVTMVAGQLIYDLPEDFDYYMTETMWKSYGARRVIIPTSNRYWAFIKAGNPGSRIDYHAQIINGKLEFLEVTDGDIINFDYASNHLFTAATGATKERYTEDTDKFNLNDNTLVLGIKGLWKIEKEMPTGTLDMANFMKSMKRDMASDTPAKVIRNNDHDRYTPYTPPISSEYMW